MIQRSIEDKLQYFATKYPIVTVTGPRQSGKTTLIKSAFPTYDYINFEDPDVLHMAKDDPRLFLKQYSSHAIFDEVQRIPELFSYLQNHLDSHNQEGMFILSGSQNFLLMEKISQSLAGRTAILKLLPFSKTEISYTSQKFDSPDSLIFKGGYPRLYDKDIAPAEFYPFYIQTYIERDVRQLQNITNMDNFVRFVKLCAGRIGQLLNLSSIANECGITQPTAKAWLSVLETSYIIYLLKPYHKNYNKRLVKTPKLYFYDTGIASSLLGIKDHQQLFTHYLRGGLFENWVITELIKEAYNNAEVPSIYFWRDNIGNEIDLLIEKGNLIDTYEIKSSATFNASFFKGLKYWNKITGEELPGTVVYGGDKSQITPHGKLISWKEWA
jgi:predicted AAA+ superfamily ATPase